MSGRRRLSKFPGAVKGVPFNSNKSLTRTWALATRLNLDWAIYLTPTTWPDMVWGIVTTTKRGGLGLKVMGPDLPNPDKTVFSMQMRGAKTYVQLDNGRPTIKAGAVRNYSIGLFTGYFVGVNTFQVTQAVFYYLANPTP